jgi:hypothetical protein
MSAPEGGNDIEPELRALGEHERAVLAALLDVDFPGQSALLAQASEVSARRIDANGSLALAPGADTPRAEVMRRIPVEAEFDDQDGVTAHVLLHVVDGYLNELEVYREDSAPLQREPAPEDFRLIVL